MLPAFADRWIRWYEGGRREYRGGFLTEDIAQRVLAGICGRLAMQRAGLPPDPRSFPVLDELAAEWIFGDAIRTVHGQMIAAGGTFTCPQCSASSGRPMSTLP